MSKNTPNYTDDPIDRMSDDDIEPAAEDVSEVEQKRLWTHSFQPIITHWQRIWRSIISGACIAAGFWTMPHM